MQEYKSPQSRSHRPRSAILFSFQSKFAFRPPKRNCFFQLRLNPKEVTLNFDLYSRSQAEARCQMATSRFLRKYRPNIQRNTNSRPTALPDPYEVVGKYKTSIRTTIAPIQAQDQRCQFPSCMYMRTLSLKHVLSSGKW